MTFDEYGRRNFEPRVGEFQSNKFIETAIWNQEKGIHSTRTEEERESELRETIERKVFKVTTRVVKNFLFKFEIFFMHESCKTVFINANLILGCTSCNTCKRRINPRCFNWR